MPSIQKLIFLLTLSSLFTGCQSKPDSIQAETIDIHNEAPQDLVPVDDYFEFVEFVKLKMPPKHFVAYIDKIQTFQNHLYIHDSQSNKLLLFDKNGNFKKQIGVNGQGPGEYSEIDVFYVDPYRQEIVVYDNGNQKTIYYDYIGNFLHQSKYGFYFGNRILLNKDTSILFTKGYNNQHLTKGENYKFIFANRENKIFKGVEKYENRLLSLAGDGVLQNFFKYDNKILFYEFFSDTISEINEYTRKPRYLLKFNKNPSKTIFYDNPTIKYSANKAIKENYPFVASFFIETQKGCFLNYIYNNGMTHFVVYDKNTKNTKINTKSIAFKNSSMPMPEFWSGEFLVSTMNAETVKFFRDISPLVKQNTSEEDTDENTNPVLVFFKPK